MKSVPKPSLNWGWFQGIGLYLCLTALCLPSNHKLLPNLGNWISQALEGPIAHCGSLIIRSIDQHQWNIYSDSPGMWLMLGLLIPLSLGLFWIISFSSYKAQISNLLSSVLLVFIGLRLAQFGMSKLLLLQFTQPEANLLYTPLGMLDKDILYWSTIGRSPGYSRYLGLVEVGLAILLTSKKYRPVALALISLVTAHIFITDICYEINVLGLSGLLLSVSLYLLYPSFKGISYSNEQGGWQLATNNIVKGHKTFSKSKLLILVIISLEVATPLLTWNTDRGTVPEKYRGAFELKSNELNIERLFIHSAGYLILQDRDLMMQDYPIDLDPISGRIYLQPSGQNLKLTELSEGRYLLDGMIDERSINTEITRISN